MARSLSNFTPLMSVVFHIDVTSIFLLKEMMENALMKQRAGIVQKQIAVGREFKVSQML